MTHKEMLRRIQNGEDVQHVIETASAESRAEFRSWMLKWAETNRGVEIALEHYDAAMRDLDSGVMGARSTWHSISPAQQRALRTALEDTVDGKWVRGIGAGVSTIRALCARDLMAWDGGAFDPEAAAVITERGRFVLAHGPTKEIADGI